MAKTTGGKMYAMTVGGKRVRVTVPPREAVAYSGEPQEVLREVLRDLVGPQAVAVIASYLQSVCCKDDGVERQVAWFREQLVAAVGGPKSQAILAEDMGL